MTTSNEARAVVAEALRTDDLALQSWTGVHGRKGSYMEVIKPPTDGSAFAFWGNRGRLPQADGLPNVELRYRTEPPHGDFLYSLEIGDQVVADEAGIRMFWGRNVILSPCAAYLAITEHLKGSRGSYSVFNIRNLTEQRRRGFFQVSSLNFPILVVRPWVMETANVSYGKEKQINLKTSGKWKSVSTGRYPDDVPISWPPW